MMKTCSKCGNECDISNFYKDGDRIRAECKDCTKEKARKYEIDNKDKINFKRRQDGSTYKKWRKGYYRKNKVKQLEQGRAWRQTPLGVWCAIHTRAGKHNIPFDIDRLDFIKWYSNVEKLCEYCGIDVHSNKKYRGHNSKRLTIDRMDSNKGYSMDNIVLACAICNTTKSNVLTYEQMKIVGKMIKMNREQNIILPSYKNRKESFPSDLGGCYDSSEMGAEI